MAVRYMQHDEQGRQPGQVCVVRHPEPECQAQGGRRRSGAGSRGRGGLYVWLRQRSSIVGAGRVCCGFLNRKRHSQILFWSPRFGCGKQHWIFLWGSKLGCKLGGRQRGGLFVWCGQ